MTKFRLIIVYIMRHKCLYIIIVKSEALKNDEQSSDVRKYSTIHFPHATHSKRFHHYYPIELSKPYAFVTE